MLNAQVSGVVNDSDGFPDEGAVVQVKGKDTSTTTDIDGVFTIDAVVGSDEDGYNCSSNRNGSLYTLDFIYPKELRTI